MLKKIFVVIILSMNIFCFYGCYSAGKATGKAVQKIEKTVEDFKKGYEDAEADFKKGYEDAEAEE